MFPLSETPEAQEKMNAQERMEQLLHANLARKMRDLKPMVLVAGAPGASSINGVKKAVVPEDAELLEKTKTLRIKLRDVSNPTRPLFRAERLTEFFARTGIAASQVRSYSKRDLERLYEIKVANADDIKPKSSNNRRSGRTGDELVTTMYFGPAEDAPLLEGDAIPDGPAAIDTWQ